MLKQNSHIILVGIVIIDLIILICSYLASRYLTIYDIALSSWTIKEMFVSSLTIGILYIALEKFEFSHTYRFKPLFIIIKNIIFFEIFLTALFFLIKLFKIFPYSDTFILYNIIITFTIFFTERVGIKLSLILLRKQGYNFKRFLIIGAGEIGMEFYRMIKPSDELGVKIIGFLDDDKKILDKMPHGLAQKIKPMLLGTTSKIESILESKNIDNVIIALPMNAEKKIINILSLCEKYGIKAELIPRYFKIITGRPSFRRIKRLTLIGIREVPLENMFNRFIKRLCDIGFSLIGLLILFPFFFIITIIIKMESKGPIFFRQNRTGYNQKEFKIIKFRTMRLNDDADKKQATKNDPRKTAFGDFLRKTNIDELPQLINILKGDMSLVGPRPHMTLHTEEFYKKYDKYLIRHWVKPGLTGWAQVNGWRGDSDIGIRTKFDIEYIENWSLFLDFKIIFLTIFGKKVKNNAF